MRTSPPTAAGLAVLFSLATVPAFSIGAAAGALTGPVPTCDGKAATIVVAPAGFETPRTVGTPGDDVIVGTDGWDRIDGAGGDDTICGLDGADAIIGGPGNDRLFGGEDAYTSDDDYWGDIIQPGPGDDYVDLGADIGPGSMFSLDLVHGQKISYADAPGPVHVDLGTLTATGHGTDTFAPTPADKYTGIVGSPFDDVLTGGPAHDDIEGGGGDDVITGGPGDDQLAGDAFSDFDHDLEAAPGDDVIDGGPGDDLVAGGYGRDVVRGEQGDDSVVGLDDAEGTLLLGGPGADTVYPAPGSVARGQGGDDEFSMDVRRPKPGGTTMTVAGGPGRDRVTFDYYEERNPGYDLEIHVPNRVIRHHGTRWARLTSVERFQTDGTKAPGTVTFRGGPQSEEFRVFSSYGFTVRAFGGGGNDLLVGGNLDDLLHGGRGRDRILGGRGQDRCVAGERVESCERRR